MYELTGETILTVVYSDSLLLLSRSALHSNAFVHQANIGNILHNAN